MVSALKILAFLSFFYVFTLQILNVRTAKQSELTLGLFCDLNKDPFKEYNECVMVLTSILLGSAPF